MRLLWRAVDAWLSSVVIRLSRSALCRTSLWCSASHVSPPVLHPGVRHRTFPHPHFTLVLDIARFRVVPTSPLPHADSLASSPGPVQLNSSPVSYLFYLRFCPPAMLQKWDGEDTPRRNSHTKSYRKVIAFFDAPTCRERRASGRKIENHLTTFPVDNLLKTTISSSR